MRPSIRKVNLQIGIYFMVVLSACSSSVKFNGVKWKMKDMQYHRIEQIEVVCKDILTKGSKRQDIISLLGISETNCDSSNALYGTFMKAVPFENFDSSFVIANETIYYGIVNSLCSADVIVDRYVIGFNGSGPDYLAVLYNKRFELEAVFFERTEF